MRRLLRVSLAAFAALIPAVLLAAGPAAAKVPSDVVLTSVATGRTVALGGSAPEFMPLAMTLVLAEYDGTLDPPEPISDAAVAAGVTVRWHFAPDGPLSQIDQVFPGATGDSVWVRTDPAPYTADDYVLWHRASASLGPLLARLGLFEPGGLKGTAGRGETPAGGDGPVDGWWWALAGLAAGSGATALGWRWRRGATAG
ncbi:hypothetical protein [Actinacidiphila sp. bgisy160]|uniref:hypothetical protein n=1 Tax=Actinacidiphila sp. bgisy160 TaxID=3413796 RepID=UPI003D746D9F